MTRDNTKDNTKELLTVSEVARIFRVDDTTVRRWAKGGALQVVTLPTTGKRQGYRVRRATVDKLLEATSAAKSSRKEEK